MPDYTPLWRVGNARKGSAASARVPVCDPAKAWLVGNLSERDAERYGFAIRNDQLIPREVSDLFDADTVHPLEKAHAACRDDPEEADELLIDVHTRIPRRVRCSRHAQTDRGPMNLAASHQSADNPDKTPASTEHWG